MEFQGNTKVRGQRHAFTLTCTFLLSLFAISPNAYAIAFDDGIEHLSLGIHTRHLQTQDTEAGIQEALEWDQASLFTQSNREVPTFGFSQSIWWFATNLQYQGTTPQEFLFEIAYPMLDDVQVYVVRSGAVAEKWHIGDKFAFSNRPIGYRNFVLPLQARPGDALTIYLRVQTSGSVQLPLELWSKSGFRAESLATTFTEGAYFGLMFVMLLYNLCLWFWTGQKSYAFYSSYVFTVSIFVAGLHGLCFQYLWPESVAWHGNSVAVFTYFW